MGEIKTFQTTESNTRKAAQEFYEALSGPELELVVFFCSTYYDLDILAEEFNRLFDTIQVIGCTTSGEIGPIGYISHSISGFSLPCDTFQAAIEIIEELHDFSVSREQNVACNLLDRINTRTPAVHFDRCFAFMLIDGLSRCEERVIHVLQQVFDTIPLIGGSAGDDLKLTGTNIYYNGSFHAKAAVVTLIQTSLPFTVFIDQYFIASDNRLVVTRADPQKRLIFELNGNPAAEEYARFINCTVNNLNSEIFARFPALVRIANMDFVRSIQKVNSDDSLTLFCTIEEGVVLRIGQGGDIMKSLRELFESIKIKIGKPAFILGYDCILRRMEIINKELSDKVETIFKDNHVVGFNSYGEQFKGIHMNQTFTGIAFGWPLKNN